MEKDKMKSNSKVPRRKGTNNQRKRDFYKDKKEPKVEKDVANDPKWYLKNGALPKSVANFSFDYATGDKVVISPFGYRAGTAADDAAGTMHIPGIGVIYTVPCVGRALDETDPVNVAAMDIYSNVRHANSGHANYDPPDLMIYLLAMDSIYTYWSWMTRLYGVCKTYSQTNRYIGDALITACGGDPNDLRKHLAEFNAYINQFAIAASVLAVPANMSLFARHSWMYQNIYMDEDNPRAQFYLYAPAMLHKFELDAESKGMLKAIPICMSTTDDGTSFLDYRKLTFDQITTIGDTMLQAALQQEDCGIMSGDIRKAYGVDQLWHFAQLDLNYAVAPIFSEEVLLQIHNSNFAGDLIGYLDDSVTPMVAKQDVTTGLSITQRAGIGEGALRFFPILGAAPGSYHTKILDTWKDDTSPEAILVATRNMFMATRIKEFLSIGGVQVVAAALQTCGSELCLFMKIFKYDNGQLTAYSDFKSEPTGTHRNQLVQNIVCKFNEYPLYYWLTTSNNMRYIEDVVGELTNFTTLDMNNLLNIHKTALLSMFNVPNME